MSTDNQIATLWASALESSVTLAQLCTDRFGKEQFVRKGMRTGHELNENDAPFLTVIPFADEDGFENEHSTQKVVITIGIVDKVMEPLGSRGETARGTDSMGLMEQVVRDVLGATEEPPSRWTGEYECPGPDFYIRHILYEIEAIRTIG